MRVFTVHSHSPPFCLQLDMGSVDPKARGVENFENRSGEEFHVNSLLTRL